MLLEVIVTCLSWIALVSLSSLLEKARRTAGSLLFPFFTSTSPAAKSVLAVSSPLLFSTNSADNEAQVYALRDRDTQTKKDAGTNPPIVTTYIAGLRGKPLPDSRAVSKYVRQDRESKESGRKEGLSPSSSFKPHPESLRARVVTLQLDL